MGRESALQSKVVTWLRRSFGGEWEVRSPSAWSNPGVADIIGCFRGRYVAIELKRSGHLREFSPDQRRFVRKINEAGGYAFCSDDFAEIRQRMRDLEHDAAIRF